MTDIRSIDPHYSKKLLLTPKEAGEKLHAYIEASGGIHAFCEAHGLSETFVYRSIREGKLQGKLAKIMHLKKVNLYEFSGVEESTKQEQYRAKRKHHREVIAPAIMEALKAAKADRGTY